jgi:hypothetical protein
MGSRGSEMGMSLQPPSESLGLCNLTLGESLVWTTYMITMFSLGVTPLPCASCTMKGPRSGRPPLGNSNSKELSMQS